MILIMKILLHNEYKIINLWYPTYVYQFFNFPYNYKNRLLASFQTRAHSTLKVFRTMRHWIPSLSRMRPSSGAEDSSSPADPWDVLSGLALLVVEGRTPGGEKGFHAGPHCPVMANTRPPPPHFCTPSENSAVSSSLYF